MLRRTNIIALVVVVTAGLAVLPGCPERTELIEHAGGAPGRQVDEARLRVKAAEDKIQAKTDAAAAIE